MEPTRAIRPDDEPAPSRVVMVLGTTDSAEFQSIVQWLYGNVVSAACTIFSSDLATAKTQVVVGTIPDLIIVLQSSSNQFSASEANDLLTFAPLARVVVCYGAWCESDGRNQSIWPTAVRVPAWSAADRIAREWQTVQNKSDAPPLPLSASRDEVFEADHPLIALWNEHQRVLIDSPDAAYRDFLAERFVLEGHEIVQELPTVILFDADPWSSARSVALKALHHQFGQAEIYATLSLPLPEHVTEIQKEGVRTVLSKLGFRPQT